MATVNAVGSALGRVTRTLRQQRNARRYPWMPILVVTVLLICAAFADIISPHDPRGKDESIKIRTQKTMLPPFQSWDNPLGTDRTGRDVLSRMIYGARTSAVISMIALGSGAVVGTILGLAAGYRGGWIDAITMRVGGYSAGLPINSCRPAHHRGNGAGHPQHNSGHCPYHLG